MVTVGTDMPFPGAHLWVFGDHCPALFPQWACLLHPTSHEYLECCPSTPPLSLLLLGAPPSGSNPLGQSLFRSGGLPHIHLTMSLSHIVDASSEVQTAPLFPPLPVWAAPASLPSRELSSTASDSRKYPWLSQNSHNPAASGSGWACLCLQLG